MFRKTASEHQRTLFFDTDNLLTGKSKDFYLQQNSWHNLFRNQVTLRIDENIFSKLYSKDMGAPNASVRILIAMMIIKEAYGWSDAQLFEQGRFNFLVRSALGIFNMDDALPTESTYYLLRQRVVDYEKINNKNLIEEAFASITKGQAAEFEVNGKSIRMDSKLLGSNIAWFTRYEVVHETLRLYYKELKKSGALPIDKNLVEQLNAILKEEGDKVVFRHTRDEIKFKLQQLGILIDKLLNATALPQSESYQTLCKVFTQQYRIDENKLIITRDKEEITSDSIQSPHDIDSHYRNKDGNQVRGYSINLTESCDKEELHLISHVDVRPVSAADNNFLEDGVKQSQEIFTADIENLHTDGAYQSPENQAYCQGEGINFYPAGMHGAKGRYDLLLTETNELVVTDTVTGEIIAAKKLKGQEKWGIRIPGRNRYFTQKEIEACALRKQIEDFPATVKNVRNNVESTIFQFGYHYPNDKSRYRGLSKHKMWANIRCLWVNFARILKYITKSLLPAAGECKTNNGFVNSTDKSLLSELIFVFNSFAALFCPSYFFLHRKNFF